jgi:hypothetical protein
MQTTKESVAKNSTEVLKAALWILENVGWIKGRACERNELGKVIGLCASGAIKAVNAVDYNLNVDAHTRVERVVRGTYKWDCGNGIIGFNDNKSTTKEDVINAFKRAIGEINDK